MSETYKTNYPEDYKFYCKGYLGQTLASDSKKSLSNAIKNWPEGNYVIKKNKSTK